MREPILVFDIETVPDVEGGRRLLGLDAHSDADVWTAMKTQRLADKGHDFMPPGIHAVGLRYHGDSPLVSQLLH